MPSVGQHSDQIVSCTHVERHVGHSVNTYVLRKDMGSSSKIVQLPIYPVI